MRQAIDNPTPPNQPSIPLARTARAEPRRVWARVEIHPANCQRSSSPPRLLTAYPGQMDQRKPGPRRSSPARDPTPRFCMAGKGSRPRAPGGPSQGGARPALRPGGRRARHTQAGSAPARGARPPAPHSTPQKIPPGRRPQGVPHPLHPPRPRQLHQAHTPHILTCSRQGLLPSPADPGRGHTPHSPECSTPPHHTSPTAALSTPHLDTAFRHANRFQPSASLHAALPARDCHALQRLARVAPGRVRIAAGVPAGASPGRCRPARRGGASSGRWLRSPRGGVREAGTPYSARTKN